MESYLKKFKCTDPDTLQFARKISDTCWEYRELNTLDVCDNPLEKYLGYGIGLLKMCDKNDEIAKQFDAKNNWSIAEIDLSDYTEQGKLSARSAFGWNKSDYSREDWVQLTCEAIFETSIFEF